MTGQRPANLPSDLWDDIKKQREEGGYPWTHLSHDQDAEVWIDPVALPPDISRSDLNFDLMKVFENHSKILISFLGPQ